MTALTFVEFSAPYLIFLGDSADPLDAKTGLGIAHWRRERCLAQLRLPGCAADAGLPDMTVSQAAEAGARTFIVGVAPIGGRIPTSWIALLQTALGAGLDLVAGLHVRLSSIPALVEAAAERGRRLVDVRVPPADLPVASGRKRTGRRLLTVGTDCAVGKKYTALAIEQEMRRRGWNADFRATGQTGIMIAGSGIPIDAVISDFIAGAAEQLSPDNSPDHWDVIEGQGALTHPGYAGVTLGLLHGSQPDAFVVCHELGRESVGGWPDFRLPDVAQLIAVTKTMGALTNPAIRCVGVAINSASAGAEARRHFREEMQDRLGLPCVDPVIDGTGALVDYLERTL
jgi:uncharacterized NAD-dependent epimerase/dehydratase family protein